MCGSRFWLWQALQDDEMPYIESLGEHWGELCGTPDLAVKWVDEFLPLVEHIWSPQSSGHGYFKGTSACLASLYAAGRNEQLLIVTHDGQYDFQGRMYPSLSMIAREITGTRWSGPLFFGLKAPATTKKTAKKGARP